MRAPPPAISLHLSRSCLSLTAHTLRSHGQGGRLSGLEGESLFYFKENPAGLLFQGQEGAPVTQTQRGGF